MPAQADLDGLAFRRYVRYPAPASFEGPDCTVNAVAAFGFSGATPPRKLPTRQVSAEEPRTPADPSRIPLVNKD